MFHKQQAHKADTPRDPVYRTVDTTNIIPWKYGFEYVLSASCFSFTATNKFGVVIQLKPQNPRPCITAIMPG